LIGLKTDVSKALHRRAFFLVCSKNPDFRRERGGDVRKTGVYTSVHEDFEYGTNEAIERKDDF
jgi:hypothetical protein